MNNTIVTITQNPFPTKRTLTIANYFVLLFLAVCIAKLVHKESVGKTIKDTSLILVTFIIILTISEVLARLCYFSNELPYVGFYYDGDTMKLLHTAFHFNPISFIVIITCIVSFLAMIGSLGECPFYFVWSFKPIIGILATLFAYILFRTVMINESRINTSLNVSCMGGLDYGTGMAYSYFYGYLKIILPNTGMENKGFLEKLRDYEAREGIEIPVKKLFILIPSSSHIPPDFNEVSNGWMEATKPMMDEQRDRAGTKRRPYRNSVYKIYPGGSEKSTLNKIPAVYVVAEGATPLLTFYEVQQHFHAETATFKAHNKEIVAAFYKKLLELLKNDMQCRNLYELVYYEDYDENGKLKNVGKVLLERIEKLQQGND